jgi:3-oxoacyl-[acyl-carrier protein] reductase
LGATGVTVNNVQPGPIDTELSPADGPMAETLKKLTSVGRFGKSEEVAEAVALLVSPQSAFINGETSQSMAAGALETNQINLTK